MKKFCLSLAAVAAALSLISCADTGTGTGNPMDGNVTIQSNPLAGPDAASIGLTRPGVHFARVPGALFELLMGPQKTFASVSPFAEFKACNDTLVFIDNYGNQINVNGTTAPSVGQGLLTFSPTDTLPMTIGRLFIPVGTVISEIDITFAVKPEVCGGAGYAVRFNDGVNGVKDITQNTQFKFPFTGGNALVTGENQTLTLLFGAIVNGMVSLGASLDNDTIQTVNVGQAR